MAEAILTTPLGDFPGQAKQEDAVDSVEEAAPPQVTALPAAETYKKVIWVSPSGSDTAAGTEGAPYRTLAKAISQVQPGEAVFAKTGTYFERLVISARDGNSSQWITVRAAPNSSPIIKGGTGGTAALLDVRRAYWHFDGFTLDVAGDKAFAAIWRTATGHHGILRNCVAKNGTAGAGINIAEYASNVTVERCDISNFKRVPLDDSHGVIVQTTTKNVVVRESNIHHNSGDGVQCIGPEGAATQPGTLHDNLLVENNLLHENRENGVDVKSCTHVTLRGNEIWGHHVTTSAKGEGIVVHMSAKDVVIEDNLLRDNARGISIGGNRVYDPPTNISIWRNQLLNGSAVTGDEGTGLRVDTAWNVLVYNNTIANMPANCLGFGAGVSGATDRLDVRNNIFVNCGQLVKAGPQRSKTTFNANLYYRTGGGAQWVLDGVTKSLATWRSATGWDAISSEQDPKFVNPAGLDYRLTAASPARQTGLKVGLPYCGTAPDQGALQSGC